MTTVEQNKSVQTMSLTGAYCVHSNVYGVDNIRWIRYLTAVDPLLSTSSAVQIHHRLTSGSIEIPLLSWCAINSPTGNFSPIGKEPVSEESPRKITGC